jgi:hypothetical protein
MLVETGFLAAGEVRQGAKGALEKPYRSTGKSWTVSVDESSDSKLALVDAFRQELEAAGTDRVFMLARFANTLNQESFTELVGRLSELLDEFAVRNDPDGTRMAFLVGGHLREAAPEWMERLRDGAGTGSDDPPDV